MKEDFEKTKSIDINDLNVEKKENGTQLEIKPAELINTDIEKNAQDEASLSEIVKNDFQEKTMVQMEVPNTKSIGIASDHRGYKLKQKLTKYLNKKGYTVVDYGTDSTKSVDYTEFGFKLGEAIRDHKVDKGIAICGSGIGIGIACNKVKGVRCAKVNNTKEAKYTRLDNDANAIALYGKMPSFRAKDIVDVFLKTKFSGLERHKRRIESLNNYKEQ